MKSKVLNLGQNNPGDSTGWGLSSWAAAERDWSSCGQGEWEPAVCPWNGTGHLNPGLCLECSQKAKDLCFPTAGRQGSYALGRQHRKANSNKA